MKNNLAFIELFILIIFLLMGCSNQLTPIQLPTSSPSPTPSLTPRPTQTLTPTITPSPTAIPTLIGGHKGQYALAVQANNEWYINIYDAENNLVRTIFKYKFDPTDNVSDYMLLSAPPTGDVICLNYQVDGVSRITIIRLDGTEIYTEDTNLGFYGGIVGNANWSPDGNWLVFTRREDGKYTNIYRVDRHGKNVEQLTDSRTEKSNPFFLPKGQRIQFYEEGFGVRIVNLEDKSTYKLGSQYPLDWTNDERYYISSDNSWRQVKLVDTETNETKIIFSVQTPGSVVHVFRAEFSPDKQWILVSEYDGDHTKKSPIPYGMAWYKVDLGNNSGPELVAYAWGASAKFTPDGTMLIIEGYLPTDDFSKESKYYAFELPELKVIQVDGLETFAEGLMKIGIFDGYWINESDQ